MQLRARGNFALPRAGPLKVPAIVRGGHSRKGSTPNSLKSLQEDIHTYQIASKSRNISGQMWWPRETTHCYLITQTHLDIGARDHRYGFVPSRKTPPCSEGSWRLSDGKRGAGCARGTGVCGGWRCEPASASKGTGGAPALVRGCMVRLTRAVCLAVRSDGAGRRTMWLRPRQLRGARANASSAYTWTSVRNKHRKASASAAWLSSEMTSACGRNDWHQEDLARVCVILLH
jgi:hypothetical protein